MLYLGQTINIPLPLETLSLMKTLLVQKTVSDSPSFQGNMLQILQQNMQKKTSEWGTSPETISQFKIKRNNNWQSDSSDFFQKPWKSFSFALQALVPSTEICLLSTGERLKINWVWMLLNLYGGVFAPEWYLFSWLVVEIKLPCKGVCGSF